MYSINRNYILSFVYIKHHIFSFQMVKWAYAILRPELRSKMTDDILKSAKVDKDGMMYLDDFLGNDDLNLFNKTKVLKLM